MIKLHPDDKQLLEFAEGTLPCANSLLVSAHCDMCHACRRKVGLLTDNLSEYVFAENQLDTPNERDYITMFEAITRGIPKANETDTNHVKTIVSVNGRSFSIPISLARCASRMDEWSYLLGKLWQSQVEIGGGHLANFIYIEKGGSVPEHTHKGNELTLVIDGKFSDGIREYNTGDFILLDSQHTHSPKANLNEGCLVFSIIDQPLYFTSGWAKLINPLSQLYFKANAHK